MVEHLDPNKLNLYYNEEVIVDENMDTHVKETHQYNIQLYQFSKVGRFLQWGMWLIMIQIQ